MHKFEHFSFDVACVQCGHPHSHQQVPFACIALHVASVSCVDMAFVCARACVSVYVRGWMGRCMREGCVRVCVSVLCVGVVDGFVFVCLLCMCLCG